MSSARCVRPNLSPRERDALAQALATVAERSFFALVEPAAAWTGDPPGATTWLQATVAFHGAFAGRMTMELPTALGRDLFAWFLGCEAGEAVDEAALDDLVGEFANMACGAWLTALERRECFTLEHPVIGRVAAASSDDALLFTVGDQPLVVRLELEGSPA